MNKAASVLIVGAGPVGLITALGLARDGIQVTILESEAAIVDSPRAVVYHWSVLEGLHRLGLLEEAKQIGFTKQDYQYLILRTKEVIAWNLEPLVKITPFPYNIHLGQNKLAQIALQHLQRLPNTSVHWSTRVNGLVQDAQGVTLQTSTPYGQREFRADWVVGADGARSAVRELLGLSFDGITWPERFVATNVRYQFERFDYATATLVVDPVHGAVIAKIDNTPLWRCTYSESASLPEESVRERMPETFKVVLPAATDYEVVQYSPYRMHQRAAERFRVCRVLLAGDAAHVTNPTGGFGLTSGLFDAFVLYEALGAVIDGEAAEDVLDHYAQQRRQVFLDKVSPRASEAKRLVYSSTDPVRLEQDLQQLRRLASDRDVLLERLLFTRTIETPSLVPQRRARHGRQ